MAVFKNALLEGIVVHETNLLEANLSLKEKMKLKLHGKL